MNRFYSLAPAISLLISSYAYAACPSDMLPLPESGECPGDGIVIHYGAPYYAWCCTVPREGQNETPSDGHEGHDDIPETPRDGGNEKPNDEPEPPKPPQYCTADMQWHFSEDSHTREDGRAFAEIGFSDLFGNPIQFGEFDDLRELIRSGGTETLADYPYSYTECSTSLDDFFPLLESILAEIPDELTQGVPAGGSIQWGVTDSVRHLQTAIKSAIKDCLNSAGATVFDLLDAQARSCPEPPCSFSSELCLTTYSLRVLRELNYTDENRQTYVRAFCKVSAKAACEAG